MDSPKQEAVLEIEFKESRVGSEQLFINGLKYAVNRRSGDTVYWRCANSDCQARACFKAGQLAFAKGKHTCTQEKNQREKSSNSQLFKVPTVQNKAQSAPEPSAALFPIFYRYQQAKKKISPPEPEQETSIQIKTEPRPYAQFDNDLSNELNLEESAEFHSDNSFNHSSEDQPPFPPNQETPVSVVEDWKPQVFLSEVSLTAIQEKGEISKAWMENRKSLTEILTVNEKNVLSNKTAWDFSKDWPTRSHCMKFIVPIRGTGVHVEQNSIPVKIINHVESIAKITEEENDEIEIEESIKLEEDIEESSSSIATKKRETVSQNNKGMCPICSKHIKSSLEQHMKIHCDVKSFDCRHCDKTFLQQRGLIVHERTHSNIKPFACSVCPSKFTTKGSLKRHMESHENDSFFFCKQCAKRFRKLDRLEAHILTCDQQLNENSDEESNPSTSNGHHHSDTDGDMDLHLLGGKRKRNPKADTKPMNAKKIRLTIEKEGRHRSSVYRDPRPKIVPSDSVSTTATMVKKFSLEELKYMPFLQPKVVLSTSLNQTLDQMMIRDGLLPAEIEPRMDSRSADCLDHNYAKPADFPSLLPFDFVAVE